MGLYKRKFNPIPNTSLVPVNTAMRIRDTVATQADLPLSGNVIGDGRVTTDTGHLYIWGVDASIGLLTDWIDQGNFVDVAWSAITGKPSSSVSDIDDAVSKKHSNSLDHVQGTDQGLDTGGLNAVSAAEAKAGYDHSQIAHAPSDAVSLSTVKSDIDIADAISKKHTQGTDSYSASQILNDSLVTGTNVDDALESLLSILNKVQADILRETAYKIDSLVGDVILTDVTPSALQTAINNLTDGQVLEIKTNASYTPIQIPSGKSFTIKNAFGYCPQVSGQSAITLLNGAADITIAGLVLENNTVSNNNDKGASIAFAHQAKVSNIMFYNITMREVVNGSAVLLSYHQSLSGDFYYTAPTLAEMSEDISFINCHFSRACKDGTEGGCITVRGINGLYIADCDIDNQNLAGRGLNIQDSINVLIDNPKILNIGGSNAEAIKFDEMGTMVGYRITGVVRKSRISGCIEGIDIDDKCDVLAMDNICLNCVDEGISVDDSALAILIHNVCYNNKYGIRLESGAITNLKSNICFNNSSANYQIENGYVLDNSNSTSRTDAALMIPIADTIPYSTTTVKAELDALISGKQDALGFTPEDVTNKDANTLLGTSDTKYPTQKAVKSYVDALGLDTSSVKNIALNIMLNSFRIAQVGALTLLQMVAGFMDEYEDESGVDTEGSTNEYYDSDGDYYTPSTSYGGIDPYVIAMLHGNGTDGSTDIIDEVGYTYTANADAQLDTSSKKFGTASLQLNIGKTGNDCIDYSSSADFGASGDADLGYGDFTIDAWIRMDEYGQYGNNPIISHDYAYYNAPAERGVSWGLIFQQESPTGPGRLIMMKKIASGDPMTYGRQTSNTFTLSLDTWYHIAVVRTGNILKFFVDGTQMGTDIDCTGIAYNRINSQPVYIGRCAGGAYGELNLNFNGHIDELRVSKGIARWTSTFTPPTGEYTGASTGNMTLLSNAQTALIVPTKIRVILFEEDVDSITLNTDLQAYASRDNGVTYTLLTLEDCGNYMAGCQILQGEVDVSGQPSGSDIKYKIETHNTKILNLHGTAVSWR